MKDALEFIIKSIVTVPDQVKVEENEEDGITNYLISVDPTDTGRLIGKEGKVIKAIRTIMRVIAIQRGVKVRITVMSDQQPPAESPLANEQDPDAITIEV